MFNNKNIEFWFWFILSCINVFTIMIANQNNDETTCIISGCMLILCFTKSLVCAMEINKNK